ncbi:MAG: hypothetical protein JNL43_07950 [Flavobacteriales bacterium]|nr:hypothetical protein [Flavobacteriales bacterium]
MQRLVLLVFAVCSFGARAQELTGEQRDTGLGFEFTVPEGWVGARAEGGYVIGHMTVPGAILISAEHHADLEALVRAFSEPTNDGNSALEAVQPPEMIADSTVKVVQSGTIEGTAVKVIGIAKLHPRNGNSANLLALAPGDVFGVELEAALYTLQESIRYVDAPIPMETVEDDADIDRVWQERLSGTRLTYLESYSSPAPTEGSIGGGYSIDRRIDLCPEGHYKTGSQSEHSFSGSDVSAYGSDRTNGSGTWRAVVLSDGSSALRLQALDGGMRDYHLGFEDGKTYLNGQRWYRTSLAADGPDYAPDCP